MTIITAVIAKPSGKRKPYALIASDTRKLSSVDGILVQSDNAKKILSFNNMYIGLAGVIPDDIFEDLGQTIDRLEMNFEDACDWLCFQLTNYLNQYNPKEINHISGYLRLTMLLITVENNIPKFAKFEYDTRDGSQMFCLEKKYCESSGVVHWACIGNAKKTIREQHSLTKQIESLGGRMNILTATQLIKNFMSATADIYPDRCNKEFESYLIEGE